MADSTEVIIDQRPLAVVLFSRLARPFFIFLLIAIFYYFLKGQPWEGLSASGYRAIGAFTFCLVLWVTQLLPLAITGLLAVVIVPVLGIMPSKEAFSFFGSEAIFFILGAFILSAALLKTGLSTRLAVLFLKRGSDSPRQLIWRILLTCALLSCIMPEHAVAAFFLPIIFEMSRALEYTPFGGSYGRSLFMAMAWGCIIGGIVTFLGGARVPLALGIIKELTDQQVGFFEWMKTTVPLAVVMLFIAYRLLLFYFPVDVESVQNISEALEKRKSRMGLMTWKEKWVALILVGAIFSWCFYGSRVGLANIAIVAVVVLFIFRVVTWKVVEEYVNWGIILMYGGAICLGRALDSSGAVLWIAKNTMSFPQGAASFLSDVLHFSISPNFMLIAFLSLMALILSELVSNVAVVAILLPVSIGLAKTYQLDPIVMVYAIGLPAGVSSLFPISTPPMALAYSSGYLKMNDLVKAGLAMNIIAWALFLVIVAFWWPVIGIKI